MATPEERLKELGITLPPVATPVANYVPFVRTGNLLFIAGQISRFLTQGDIFNFWMRSTENGKPAEIIGDPLTGRIKFLGPDPSRNPYPPEHFTLPPTPTGFVERLYGGDAGSPYRAYVAARNAAISAVAVIKEAVGDLSKVNRIVRVFGTVQCGSEFTQQPLVINGASDLFVDVFGEQGRHARVAVGSQALPFGTLVEIEVVAEIKPE